MDKRELLSVRGYRDGDKNFIFSTFLRGLYYGDSWFTHIPKDIFMANYHVVLEQLLASPNAFVVVSCLKDDPDVILGYAILNHDLTTLHWVFCKSAWRGIGIAKSLVPPTVTSVTHLTKAGFGILSKHKSVVFNPFNLTR